MQFNEPRCCRTALVATSITCGLLLSGLSGCGGSSGPARGAVRGRVTVDGQPASKGVISFVPTGGTTGPSSGGTIEDGSYEIESRHGPVVGQQRVTIRAFRPTGRKVEAGPPAPPGTMVDKIKQFLPPKYNTKSELTVEIQPGSNDLDFDLEL